MEEKLPICHLITKMLRIAIANEGMCPDCGKDLELCRIRDDDNEVHEEVNSLCSKCGYSCDSELDAIDELLSEYKGDD